MIILNTLSDTKLAELLNDGGVGIIPTDTVYGLVCRAADQAAVARLYKLKDRHKKPGTVIAASIDQLVTLGIKRSYLKPVEHFWPNPISVIIPNSQLEYIHAGVGSIAVRIPSDKALSGLLKLTGPLLTTSANLPGEPEADNVERAMYYFNDKVDFYVDAGNLRSRKPSTLIRIVDDAIEILREGAVKVNEKGEITK